MDIITFEYAAHAEPKFNLSYMIVSHFLVYLYLALEILLDNLAEFQSFFFYICIRDASCSCLSICRGYYSIRK